MYPLVVWSLILVHIFGGTCTVIIVCIYWCASLVRHLSITRRPTFLCSSTEYYKPRLFTSPTVRKMAPQSPWLTYWTFGPAVREGREMRLHLLRRVHTTNSKPTTATCRCTYVWKPCCSATESEIPKRRGRTRWVTSVSFRSGLGFCHNLRFSARGRCYRWELPLREADAVKQINNNSRRYWPCAENAKGIRGWKNVHTSLVFGSQK